MNFNQLVHFIGENYEIQQVKRLAQEVVIAKSFITN